MVMLKYGSKIYAEFLLRKLLIAILKELSNSFAEIIMYLVHLIVSCIV